MQVCDKYERVVNSRARVRSATFQVSNLNLPKDLRPKALKLYEKGLLDSEIARELQTSVAAVIGWRRHSQLESNLDRVIYEE